MHPLIQKLLTEAPIISDGAWGTQLQTSGIDDGSCPDSWCLSHPEVVENVARAYVDVGSRIILSNSFGASRLRLAEYDLADQTREINRAAAAISRRAADTGENVLVFASMGPTGKMLLMGDVTEQELYDSFAEQAESLAEGGADGIVIETMADTAEAIQAIRAVRATGLPVIASMVFDAGKDRDRTMMGLTPEMAADELLEAGADVVGANCGHGAKPHIPICQRLKRTPETPVWIKPNAGMPQIKDGKIVYDTTPAEFAAQAVELRAAGADFLGGCCGTSPAFIQAVCAQLKTT